jgi:hypothetical protein
VKACTTLFLSSRDLSLFNDKKEIIDAVSQFIAEQLDTDAERTARLHKELTEIVFSYVSGKPITEIGSLTEAIKILTITENPSRTEKVLEVDTYQKGGKILKRCSITLPDIQPNDRSSVANLGAYLSFAQAMLGISASDITVLTDKKLGQSIPLPQAIQTAMARLVTAAHSSEGFYPGEKIKFASGFIGGLPECLTALRVLHQNLPFVRKNKKDTTNSEVLKQSINTAFTLKREGGNPFVDGFIKGVLREMTQTRESHFPASFFKTTKVCNKVTTTDGILQRLGYVPKMPSTQKVIQISSNFYSKKEDGTAKIELDTKDTPHDNSHKEFGAAVKLLLPKIDCSKADCRTQLKGDTIRTTNPVSLAYYNKHAEVIDEVNKAYAFLVTAKSSRNKKTKPIHFKNQKDRALNLAFSKLEFQDSTGRKFSNYTDIPAQIRKTLQSLLHKHIKLARKAEEDDPQAMSLEMGDTPIIQAQSPRQVGKRANKKAKLSERKEAEAMVDE